MKAGTKTVRAFRGKEAVMDVALAAKLRLVNLGRGGPTIALADVPVDGRVKIRGIIDRTDLDNPVFTSSILKVKAPPSSKAPAARTSSRDSTSLGRGRRPGPTKARPAAVLRTLSRERRGWGRRACAKPTLIR